MARGGWRPGAGRPKKGDKQPVKRTSSEGTTARNGYLGGDDLRPPRDGIGDAKEFLERVVKGEIAPTREQLAAATALLPFQHKKMGETGKKEAREAAAQQAASKFTPRPRLTVVPK